MIPNYVFTKSPNEFKYNVVKRNYSVQDVIPPRSSCRSQKTGRNKSKIRSANPALKRPKHHKKADTSTQTATKNSFARSVSFRLGAGETTGNKTPKDCDMEPATQTLNMPTDPIHNAHCDLQESFTDFFSIIHDNVMESVKDAVQKMVVKCFEQHMAKMELLSQEIRNQEVLLSKIHRDLTSKMADQSETNLNQFKFVTQMLIDNQTVHYRALNQAKHNKLRRLEERDLEKEHKLERGRKRSGSTIRGRSASMDPSKRSAGGECKQPQSQSQSQSQSRGPQHKLSQQQQPIIYQISNEYKRTNTVQLQRQSNSNSMPDLAGSPSKSPAGASKRPATRPHGNKPELCLPAMTYPP
ncbi:hypothetical protein KR054_000586, partial [Drosophila jambulina]